MERASPELRLCGVHKRQQPVPCGLEPGVNMMQQLAQATQLQLQAACRRRCAATVPTQSKSTYYKTRPVGK